MTLNNGDNKQIFFCDVQSWS